MLAQMVNPGTPCIYAIASSIIDMITGNFSGGAPEATFHIAKGFEVNRDSLAVDVIKEVGPGGCFIEHKHTLDNFRKVVWFPKLTCRQKWNNRI